MSYRVFKLPIFDKRANKLFNKRELKNIENMVEKLKFNPYRGKILTYPFFREIKINDKRIYFLIYEEIAIILLVSSSNKKTQQDTINIIKKYLSEYKKYAYQLYKNN